MRKDKWQKEVYIDNSTKKVYTSFLNLNGIKHIKEIDLQSGQITRSIKIPFPYVEKIKFHNGFMYYMYKGWGDSQKKNSSDSKFTRLGDRSQKTEVRKQKSGD